VIRSRCTGVLLSLLAACGDSTAPRSATGNWTGSSTASGSLFVIVADLVDAGGAISGSGSIVSTGIECPPAVTGTRSGSAVSLTFTCPSYTPVTFEGTLSKNGRTIAGTLNSSGFTNTSLNLSKQD
jgi:hypothetical protein